MKIAVLGTRGFPGVQGGVEKHCEELYPRLAAMGCDVTVITRAPYIPKEKRKNEWKGVRFVHLWCPRKTAFEAIAHSFMGVLKAASVRPDILHIHSVGPSIFAPMAKTLGLKVITTNHGPDYERAKWGKAARAVLERGERNGALWSDGVIAISRIIKGHIDSKYGKEAFFIPNGVNVPAAAPPAGELKRWGLEPGKYVFTACRFVPEKGLHDLVDAYKAIADPPFKLVIAGDADHETEYSRRLKRLGRETKGVVLTGVLSGGRLSELFSNAGLFVLASYYEGLPIALLEALSYGLPVLVSDIPQHREIPLGDPRYFVKGDVKALSGALARSYSEGITEGEKRRLLEFVRKEYDWDDIASRTLEVYRHVLGGGNGRRAAKKTRPRPGGRPWTRGSGGR